MAATINAHIFIQFNTNSNFQSIFDHFGSFPFVNYRIGLIDKYNLSLITSFNSKADLGRFLKRELQDNPLIQKMKYYITNDEINMNDSNGLNSYLIIEIQEEHHQKISKEIAKLENVYLSNLAHDQKHIILIINSSSYDEINRYTLEKIWPIFGIMRITPYRIINLFENLQ